MNVLTEKNIKITFPVVLLIKLLVLMIGLLRELLFIQVKMQQFIKAILEEYKYCKKVMNKKFNKNLIMSEKEEHLFHQSNSCWICKKLIDNDEEKVRDHCHVTGKFRGAAYWDCHIDFQLTKKVPVIFHNLRGYDSHFILMSLINLM